MCQRQNLFNSIFFFLQTGFGSQAVGKNPKYVLRSLLVQRHVQPCPWSNGGSSLCQQLPGRLWNHTNGKGTKLVFWLYYL